MSRHRAYVVCALIAALAVRAVSAAAQCCGDCNRDGAVTVDELVTGVNHALGSCSDDGVCRSQSTQAFPATGQMTCWDDNANVIPCSGTGQDGETRAGAALAYVDNGDGTITDLNTKLMWEKLSADGTVHDQGSRFTLTEAVTTKIATLNSTNFAGHHDWRVPNLKELVSIVNYEIGFPGPPVNEVFKTACATGCGVTACSCTQAGKYWSSTNNANDPDGAWSVGFAFGEVDFDEKIRSHFVRAVRGSAVP